VRKSGWQYDVEGRRRVCNIITRRANWAVRDYVSGDEGEILSLCQGVFGSSLTLQEWKWRTFENPAGKTLAVVAREKESGRLVGHVAGIATDLKVGESSRNVFFIVDSAVDPSYRGRGIHGVLSYEMSKRCCEEEGGFAIGLPNQQAYLPTLKLGTTHILTMPLFLKVLDWRRVVHARLRSSVLARVAGALIQPFQRSRGARDSDGFTLQEVHHFGKSVDDLWGRVSPRFAVCATRKSSLLNWRYFERPGSPYRVFSISYDAEWKGYVVIRLFEKWGLRLGTLVDLFFDPDCVEAGMLLLDLAETDLRAQGADLLWALFSCPSSYQNVLKRAGFFRVLSKRFGRPFHLVADFVPTQQLRPDLAGRDGAVLRHGEQWFLSLGDTDLA
jgi:GNAT acetyltransferase-like protein